MTGNYVYPGVGYLVMAIEASRQLATEQITGFQLRRVSIRRALIVPDTKEGVEVSLSMTTAEGSIESRLWRRFSISSYNESSDQWTEHCTGHIHVECNSPIDPVDNGREEQEEALAWKNDLVRAHAICTRPMDFEATYKNLQNSGLNFGPFFRNLGEVRASGSRLGTMTGEVTVPDVAQSMPKQYMHSHLIHPATMDSMIHMMIAAVLDYTGKSSLDTIRLPTFIREMWVSANLTPAPLYKYIGHASVSAASFDKFEGQIRIMDQERKIQKLRMDGIELTRLESGVVESKERQLCTAFEWKPDLHFLDSRTACGLSSTQATDRDQNLYWVKRLQLATMLFVNDALDELAELDIMKLDLYMCRFYEWMKHWREKLVNDEIIHLPYSEFKAATEDDSLKQAIVNEVEALSAEGAITVRMGRNIVAVMRQEVDPLHLMFGQDAIMDDVYKEGLHLYDLPQHLRNHLSLLRHQRSELDVLEIGAGTGSFTAEVLNVLSPEWDTSKGSIASYTFTDVSSGFFEKAKHRFQAWNDIMTFQSLNVERNHVEQGFQVGSYDLIFAGNVIHATADLHTALHNLRSLLKPGGQLIMQEGIRQDFLWYPLVFGQLPGWWLGHERIRQWCPYIPATEWNKVLTECGFSGVDIEYPSSSDQDLTWQSVMVSTAIPELISPPQDVVILSYGSSTTADAIQILRQMFPRIGNRPNVTVVEPSEIEQVFSQDAVYISLLDLEKPFLSEITEAEYTALQKTLMHCEHMLWVTPDTRDEPFSNMSMGLLRTVRWERDADGSNIVTLAVANSADVPAADLAICMRKIMQRQFLEQQETDRHAEYLLQDNMIHIGRLREWEQADDFLAAQSSSAAPEMRRLGDVDRPIELVSVSSGSKELHWTTSSRLQAPLGDTEVEVEVRAVGLNSENGSSNLSLEAAGTVTKVGLGVESLVAGDDVVFLAGDERDHCFRTVTRVDQALAVKLPKQIPCEVAAGLPLIYAAALYGLGEVAGLCSNDSVLIHTGASAIGQAAIQYARMIGAEIFTTASRSEDRTFLVTEYDIPEDHIFSCGDLSFAKGIMRYTKGVGVDMVFNTLTGESLQESLSCVAPFGRFIDVSNKHSRIDATIGLAPLQRNVSMTSIDLPLLVRHRPKVIRRLVSDALKLYAEGKIGQIRPTTIMDFAKIQEGIDARRNGRSGKIIFVPDPSNQIPVVTEVMSPYQFDSDASYVLAGGLGGLGRSLARWMASRGAKHLVFLSRSGTVTAPVEAMVTDLKEIGCTVNMFACDISDAQHLRKVVQECSVTLPPIKGCIQGSMVLRVSWFHHLSDFLDQL